MNIKIIIYTAIFLFVAKGQAESDCPETISTYSDIIRCAESRSPDIQKAVLSVDLMKARSDLAGQWKNPEFALETFQGGPNSEKSSETDISLGVPMEWGGRLDARRSVAEGAFSQAKAELAMARMKVYNETLLNLHRLRQLSHEGEIVDEAIATFEKLIKQYSNRPKLSAEQEISASVFRMSKSEYEFKRVEVKEEKAKLESFFETSLGSKPDFSQVTLPQSPRNWPKINPESDNDSSLARKALLAEVETAKAELLAAKAESWPALTLGPSVKLLREGGNSEQLYGFNLSFPLPLFNFNGAGRSSAAANLRLAESSRQIGEALEASYLKQLLRTYDASVLVLTASLSHRDLDLKHTDIDRLFLKGIVPSSLVIESHRTYLDLEKMRNEREIKAMEAALTIYALNGKRLEFAP